MKILVPTDLSDNADQALNFAVSYAQQQCATITLIFSYFAVYDFAAEAVRMAQTIENNAKAELNKIISKVGRDVEIDFKIIQGTVANAIFSTANNDDYDLIIMGTQGASGIKKILLDPIPLRLSRKVAFLSLQYPLGLHLKALRKLKLL